MLSPADARRAGLVSVYQEPALIPDLDIAANLRLTGTPVEAFRGWVRELGVPALDIRDLARDIPLAVLRVLDLARALALQPDVLLLDEMTAALPADLAEKVLEVVRRESRTGRSVIFISHRFIEISALCDRATVLRDGETVGVVDMAPGAEEKIVELMLGTRVEKARAAARTRTREPLGAGPARLSVRGLSAGTKLQDVSFDLANGEVTGVVALEGQGQDELFAFFRDPCGHPAVPSRWTVGPSVSRIRPMRSRPASPMSQGTAPRRSSCSGPCARTSPCP